MILLRVTLCFLVLILLPDWYIYKVYGKHCRKKSLCVLYVLPAVILLSALFLLIATHDILGDYLGIYLVTALCVSVPKIFFIFSDLLLKGIRKLIRRPIPCGIISLLPALGVLGYLLFGAIKGKENFKVREVSFVSPDVPEAFDGYRILQLSDIHAGSWNGSTEALEEAVKLCNMQRPDLVAFTGDLVNSRADEMRDLMPVFSRLKAKDGVYSVLGNHDYATYTRWDSEAERLANIDTLVSRQNRMGWKVLMNENKIIYRGNDSIALLGVENSGNPPFPNYANLPKTLWGTEGMFKVLLSHDPTHWRREVLPQTDIHLMLAGHTHDMQISIGGFSVSRFIYPEHRGMYLEGNRGLYVNVGLGFVLFPMRLGAWPEITVITLRRK